MADIPTRIRAVELRVSNVEASAEFYSHLVGLETARLGLERAELRAPGSEQPQLRLVRAGRAGRAPWKAAGLFHTAFRYPDRPSLADALNRAAERTIPLTGVSDHGVSEALYLDDPDGLGIELYRDRPLEQWPQPEGGERVRMFTEHLDVSALATDSTARSRAEAARGVDIGHVHLKVADVEEAIGFWSGPAEMELMTRFGDDAGFLGRDGYHHHIGVNQWFSRGASLEPAEGPGLESIELIGERGASLTTPDGVRIEVEG